VKDFKKDRKNSHSDLHRQEGLRLRRNQASVEIDKCLARMPNMI
jgi:hypothetical protein